MFQMKITAAAVSLALLCSSSSSGVSLVTASKSKSSKHEHKSKSGKYKLLAKTSKPSIPSTSNTNEASLSSPFNRRVGSGEDTSPASTSTLPSAAVSDSCSCPCSSKLSNVGYVTAETEMTYTATAAVIADAAGAKAIKTEAPSVSDVPSFGPSVSSKPSGAKSAKSVRSEVPSVSDVPSSKPSVSSKPSASGAKSAKSESPSFEPSTTPSVSRKPSTTPTQLPSHTPSSTPSDIPSLSSLPSDVPSDAPSMSSQPSTHPSESPSQTPSSTPSDTPSVSSSPSDMPSDAPSMSSQPSTHPSELPSHTPSDTPSLSSLPSDVPSDAPSMSSQPSTHPSELPSHTPSSTPSDTPSVSSLPSDVPSDAPSMSSQPSTHPSELPSHTPSSTPSDIPSVSSLPSDVPSDAPSMSSQPSIDPTNSLFPTTSPSSPLCPSNHNPIDNEVEFCDKDYAIECGDTFTNESVVLSHDLFCRDYLSLASNEEKRALNAAITLTGPSASIDCQGHSIRQIMIQQFATACPVGLIAADDPFAPSDDRKGKKEYCGIYYQAGILLVDGATAVNCKVENFHDGFLILNGGEVQKSEALGNNHGVVIQDLAGSTESMVSDVYSHDNTLGIVVNNYATSTAAIIENTASKFNSLVGYILYGPDVTVKDSTASYNGDGGFYVQDTYTQDFTNTAKFEGTVSSHHNLKGFSISTTVIDFAHSIEVIVKGQVNAYLNEIEGLQVANNGNPSHNILFAVEDGGLFTSCRNVRVDIVSQYGVINFNDEGGAGYTCDTSAEESGGQGLPICLPCPACT